MSTRKFANMTRLNSMIMIANRSVNQHIKLSVKEVAGGLVELAIINSNFASPFNPLYATSCVFDTLYIDEAINVVRHYSSPILNEDMKREIFSYPELSFEKNDAGFTICTNKSHLLSDAQYYNAIGMNQDSALMAYNKKRNFDLEEYNSYWELIRLSKPNKYKIFHNGLFNHNTTDFCFSDLGRYTEICLDVGYKKIYRLTAKEMLESMFF